MSGTHYRYNGISHPPPFDVLRTAALSLSKVPPRRVKEVTLMLALPFLAALVAPGRVARGSDARPAARPRLVVDYLPALVYENELVPARLRAVNPGESAVECTVKLSLHAGESETPRPHEPEPVTLTLGAGRDKQVSFDCPPVGWATASIEFSVAGGGVESFWIAHFGEDEDIPVLVARGERLYVAETGDVAVLSLEQRASRPDRQWYVLKRLASSLGKGGLPARVLVLGARLSEPPNPSEETELPAYLAEVAGDSPVPVAAVALPGEGDRRAFAPMLADLAAALGALEREPPAELVVWVVACDDARRATPLGTFRKAADLLLFRARAWGAGRLVVLFVPEPAVPPGRRALYAEQLRLAAKAYRGRFARLDELAEEHFWAVEGPAGPQRALGRFPNAQGHEALARAVLDTIRP